MVDSDFTCDVTWFVGAVWRLGLGKQIRKIEKYTAAWKWWERGWWVKQRLGLGRSRLIPFRKNPLKALEINQNKTKISID